MNELKTTTNIVKAILEENEQTRNSDSFLYLKVLEHISNKEGFAINHMTVPYFLENMKEYGFPGFETVRRTRQKIQAAFPELGACEKVSAMRSENEATFREYARSKGC